MELLARRLIHDGFDVLTCGSYADALALAADQRLDWVITNLHLPDGTGTDLLHDMKVIYGVLGTVVARGRAEAEVSRGAAEGDRLNEVVHKLLLTVFAKQTSKGKTKNKAARNRQPSRKGTVRSGRKRRAGAALFRT
jgi:DNA-binding NtrC family response regulator